MRIQFCGADRTVTGSSHLLEINGLRLFLDAGMYQGPRDQARQINQYLPADVRTADAVILSHGHLDHCGKLPVFIKAGFHGPIYCTPPTAEVARVVLSDAAKIQLEDVQYLNRRSLDPHEKPLAPLYTPNDVPGVVQRFKRVPYAQKTDLGKGVSFTFYDAGHILGSAYVVIEWNEAGKDRRLLFTADVGRYDAPILNDPHPLPGDFDLVITESTYGNASHGPMANVGPQLLEAVKDCIQHKSRLLVPSFAVGRAQTIAWYMKKFVSEKLIPEIPVYIDSPMAVEITKITHQFRDYYDPETTTLLDGGDICGTDRCSFAISADDSKKINSQSGPCVIIASSPTCEFGRICHHLTMSVERPNDKVVFVGWIPPGTLGRRLQDEEKRVRILDRWYDVRCKVQTIHGLSAHADRDELLRFLKPTLSSRTSAYVVHGETNQAESFAQSLVAGGMASASVPAMESSVVNFGAMGADRRQNQNRPREEGE